MAFAVPAGVGRSVEATSVTAHDVVVPSGIVAGDRLLLVFAHFATATVTTPTGWSLVTTDNTSPGLKTYQRLADGTEVDFVLTTNNARTSVTWVYRFTGAHPGLLPEGATASGTGTAPNPPSLDPAAYGVEDSLWVAISVNRGGAHVTAYPASYPDQQFTSSPGGVLPPDVGIAMRSLAASSADPGAFTIQTSQDWVAATVVIPPAIVRTTAPALVAPALSPAMGVSRAAVVRSGAVAKTFDALTLGPSSQTVGPSSPSAGADDASVGSVAWSNPGDVTTSNDVRASVVFPSSPDATHYLVASGFGLTAPSGSLVTGVTVEVERSSSAGTKDFHVRLVRGGVIIGEDRADTVTTWPAGDAYKTYGSSTDAWGLVGLTAAEVNASNFGVAIAATGGGGNTASIDHVRVTVRCVNLSRSPAVRSASPSLASGASALAAAATRTPVVRTASLATVAAQLTSTWSVSGTSGARAMTASLAGGELVVAVLAARAPAIRVGVSALTHDQLVTAMAGSRVAVVRAASLGFAAQSLVAAVDGLDQFQSRTCDVTASLSEVLCGADGLDAAATRAGAGSLVSEVAVLAMAGELRAPTRTASASLTLESMVTVVEASRTPVVRLGVASSLSTQELAAAVAGAERFQVRVAASSLSTQELAVTLSGERSPAQRSCGPHPVLAALACEADGVEQFQTRVGTITASCGALVVAAVGDSSGPGSRRVEVMLVAGALAGMTAGRRVVKRFTARTRVAGSAGRRRPVAGAPGRRVAAGSAGARRSTVGSQSGRRAVSGSAASARLVPGSGESS